MLFMKKIPTKNKGEYMADKIQVYLTYCGGEPIKLGRPVSLQRAVEMTRSFARGTSACIPGGTAKLAYEPDSKKNGKLVFELPYNAYMKFTCDKCMGPCVTIPLDAKTKMNACREYLRFGHCKDPFISSVIGYGIYPTKYSKTR